MRWRLRCRWKPSLISHTLLSLSLSLCRPSYHLHIAFHCYNQNIHTPTHPHTHPHTLTQISINRPIIRKPNSIQIKSADNQLASDLYAGIWISALPTVNVIKCVNRWLTFDRFGMALLSPRHSREETPCPLTTTCERLLKMQHSGPHQPTLTASAIVHTARRTVLYGLNRIHRHFLLYYLPITSI